MVIVSQCFHLWILNYAVFIVFMSLCGHSIDSGSGTEAEGTITITAPTNTASGTDVTLTIDVESTGTSDSNYAVVRLSVMKKVIP